MSTTPSQSVPRYSLKLDHFSFIISTHSLPAVLIFSHSSCGVSASQIPLNHSIQPSHAENNPSTHSPTLVEIPSQHSDKNVMIGSNTGIIHSTKPFHALVIASTTFSTIGLIVSNAVFMSIDNTLNIGDKIALIVLKAITINLTKNSITGSKTFHATSIALMIILKAPIILFPYCLTIETANLSTI